MEVLKLPKEEQEKELKKIFDIANEEDFSLDVLNELAKDYDKKIDVIRRWLNSYILKYSNFSDKQIEEYTKKVSKDFIPGVNLWSTEKEKQEILDYINSFYENARDKDEAIKSLSSIYKLSKKKIEKLVEIASKNRPKVEVKPRKRKQKAKKEEVLIEVEMPKLENKTKKKETNYSKLYDILIEASTPNEIEKIIDEFKDNNKFINFKASLEEYLREFRKEYEYDYLKDIIEDRIKKYRQIKEHNKYNKDNDSIEEIINFVNNYIKSDMNLREYLNRHNVSDLTFKTYATLIRKYDVELFSKLTDKVKQDSVLETKRFSQMVKDIVNKIRKGIILDNGTYKDFDILDYHIYTNYSLKELLNKSIGIISEEDYRLLKSFSIKNPFTAVWSDLSIKNYYTTKTYMDAKMDKRGNITNYSYELTTSDKDAIINYLKDNNIPIYQKTVAVAEKKYINNELYLEESIGLQK